MAVMLGSARAAGLSSIVGLCSESELLAAARAGDDRAFEELYSRYHGRIHAFIFGRVHDHGRSDDIAQEVFMSALRRLRSSEQEIAFKPWIYEIAKNACIDEFRRNQRAREVSLDADDELASGSRALPAVAPTPPAAIENKQRLSDLQGAFGGLSESHHQLLVMREFEGLSYDEIGRRTGMSRQMVESALFRARRKLSEEYDELASGRRCQQVQLAIADGRAQVARTLGVRERRQLARHLAHCQPCRSCAHQAGVDESLLRPRSIAAKIAALLPLPLPLWRWPWRRGAGARNALAGAGSHPMLAQGATLSDAAGPASGLSGAAIAAAVIALGGAGGAVVSGLSSHSASKPRITAPAAHSAALRHVAGADPRTRVGGSAKAIVSRSGARHHRRLRRARTSTSGPGGSTGAPANRGGSLPGSSPPAGGGGTLRSTVNSASGSTIGKTTSGAASSVHQALTDVTNSSGPSLGSVASGAGSTVSPTVGNTVNSVGNTVNSVGNTVNSVGNTVNSVGKTVNSVGNTVSAVGKTVNSVGNTVNSVGNPIKSVGGSVGSTGGVANTVGNAAKAAGSAVGSVGSTGGVANTVGNAAKTAGSAVGSVGSAVGSVGKAVSSAGSAVSSIGSALSSAGATGASGGNTKPRSTGALQAASGSAASSATGAVKQVASSLL